MQFAFFPFTFFLWLLLTGVLLPKYHHHAQAKVAVIGSGNWGTAVAKKVAENLIKPNNNGADESADEIVRMWVYEEVVDGRNLTDIINTDHTNVKYLPGIKLPATVVACSDLLEACEEADFLLFVVPHQFLPRVLQQLRERGCCIKPDAIAVSLIKGLAFDEEKAQPLLLSEMLKKELGVRHVAVVMGANIAADVAAATATAPAVSSTTATTTTTSATTSATTTATASACVSFAETTVAAEDLEVAQMVASLFDSAAFRTQISTDVSSVELCGALKNVIAVGAGICDGLNLSPSSKAALVRQGLREIGLYCRWYKERVSNNAATSAVAVADGDSATSRSKAFGNSGFPMETLLQSCGVADLIVTCYSGRNRRCAERFAQLRQQRSSSSSNKSSDDIDNDSISQRDVEQLWKEIEASELSGQQLQGIATCEEVIASLPTLHTQQFPLMRCIHGIACRGKPLRTLFDWN